jgi:hypothetical protein
MLIYPDFIYYTMQYKTNIVFDYICLKYTKNLMFIKNNVLFRVKKLIEFYAE